MTQHTLYIANNTAVYVMQFEKTDHLAWSKKVEISMDTDIAEKCLHNAMLSLYIPHSMTKL